LKRLHTRAAPERRAGLDWQHQEEAERALPELKPGDSQDVVEVRPTGYFAIFGNYIPDFPV